MSDAERRATWLLSAKVHDMTERVDAAERAHAGERAVEAIKRLRQHLGTIERVSTSNEFGRGYQRGQLQESRNIERILTECGV
jgi:hypothetical protein